MARRPAPEWMTGEPPKRKPAQSYRLVEPKSSKALTIVMEVVDNQLRDNDPPETQQTLDRLVAAGHPLEMARRLIGAVLLSEMNRIMKNEELFDNDRYVAALHRLPKLPKDA
jgi:hypothetical protein